MLLHTLKVHSFSLFLINIHDGNLWCTYPIYDAHTQSTIDRHLRFLETKKNASIKTYIYVCWNIYLLVFCGYTFSTGILKSYSIETFDCLQLHELYSPPGSSVHGDSPGKNTGVGCLALLQGIFPNQGLNPGLPHCRWILYCLSC